MWRILFCVGLLGACGTDTGCPESTASYCSAHGGCSQSPPLTWQAAQDPRNWGCSSCPSPTTRMLLLTCPDASTAIFAGIDTGTTYHYDTRGMLDRITAYGIRRRTCIAGDIPDPGEEPAGNCTQMELDVCCTP